MSNIVEEALEYIDSHYGPQRAFDNTKDVGDFFCLRLAFKDREIFSVAFLNSQLRLIEVEDVFIGTIHKSIVFAREIVRKALLHNCSAVILCHNHPSGNPKPSSADKEMTHELIQALKLIDVRVLDHIIVGGAKHISFAEQGLL